MVIVAEWLNALDCGSSIRKDFVGSNPIFHPFNFFVLFQNMLIFISMGRKKSNIHYIYKTTCNVTGKWYVGMHSTSNEDDGYMGSGKILRYSIRKHGKDNHTKEILEYCDSRELLVLREIEIVNKELIGDGLCMNLKEGGFGGGGFTPEQQKLNAIKSNERQKILREDPEWVKNKSEKQSLGNKKTYEDGRREKKYFHDWNGKKHSEESKQKMCKSKNVGENNSQYGTCWITKGGENKKIKKDDLDNWVDEGWVKGRK